MGQLLIIRNANTPSKHVGDIIAVRDDDHKFSSYENIVHNVVRFCGTSLQLYNDILKYRIERAFTISEKELWRNPGTNTWFYLKKSPKFALSLKDLTPQELSYIAVVEPGPDRDFIVSKMVVNPGEYEENLTPNILEYIMDR